MNETFVPLQDVMKMKYPHSGKQHIHYSPVTIPWQVGNSCYSSTRSEITCQVLFTFLCKSDFDFVILAQESCHIHFHPVLLLHVLTCLHPADSSSLYLSLVSPQVLCTPQTVPAKLSTSQLHPLSRASSPPLSLQSLFATSLQFALSLSNPER